MDTSKEDARKILKANGYSDAQIAKIEASKGESTVREASTGKFKIYIDGRYRYFDSLDAAKKAAQEIFAKTGIVVAIVAASGGKVAEASEVAQTILSQITSGVRMSLGARDFVGALRNDKRLYEALDRKDKVIDESGIGQGLDETKKVKCPKCRLVEGGHSYIHTLPGSLSKTQVGQEWKKLQGQERDINGHREGYSGDSQTMSGNIVFHSQTHPDSNAASNAILDKHKKWDAPHAAKYKHTDGKDYWAVGGWAAS